METEPDGLRREPCFSQPNVDTRSLTAPNYMIFWCSCDKQTSLKKNWSENTQRLMRCAFWVISLIKNVANGYFFAACVVILSFFLSFFLSLCQNGSKTYLL